MTLQVLAPPEVPHLRVAGAQHAGAAQLVPDAQQRHALGHASSHLHCAKMSAPWRGLELAPTPSLGGSAASARGAVHTRIQRHEAALRAIVRLLRPVSRGRRHELTHPRQARQRSFGAALSMQRRIAVSLALLLACAVAPARSLTVAEAVSGEQLAAAVAAFGQQNQDYKVFLPPGVLTLANVTFRRAEGAAVAQRWAVVRHAHAPAAHSAVLAVRAALHHDAPPVAGP